MIFNAACGVIGQKKGPIQYSIDYDGVNQSLSMSNTNFGSYNRQKFSIFGSINLDAIDKMIVSKTGNTSGNREFMVDCGYYSSGKLSFIGEYTTWRITSTTTLTTSGWYAFLVHYDSAQAVSTDRLKMWINNSQETVSGAYPSLNDSVPSGTADVKVGTFDYFGGGNSDFMNGRIRSLGMTSGTLLQPSDWFDGSAGKVKDVSGASGLKFLMLAPNGIVTTDSVLATAWTNNNGATASSSIP